MVCANDLMALGVLSEAKSVKINVPEEMAIVGFEDIEITVFNGPPLTTVRQPLYDMGLTASEMLFRKIKNPKLPPEYKIFPVELIVRKSS